MLTVKRGKEEQQLKDNTVEAAVRMFIETKSKIDALNEALKLHKETITQAARTLLDGDEAQTLTFGVDDEKVKVSFGYDIKVTDSEALAQLLGERFDDLVKVSTTYKPETKLKEMALEDDGLKACLSVKEKAPAVSVVK